MKIIWTRRTYNWARD